MEPGGRQGRRRRAVVLNSGGANCYTGAEGFQTTHAVAERVADGLGIGAVDVVVCSTGLIGLTTDRTGCSPASTRGRRAWRPTAARDAADAIMTTDTVSKQVVVEGAGWSHRRDGQGRRHARAAARHDARRAHHRRRRRRRRPRRGPARRDPGQLRPARLRRLHVHQRHRRADGQRRLRHHADRRRLHRAPSPEACTDLAMQLLADAEGADHEIAITVLHAATEDEPVEVGRASPAATCSSRGLRQGPQLGPGAGHHRHHRGGVRPRRPRRRDERRLGLPRRPPRRGPGQRRPRAAARSA